MTKEEMFKEAHTRAKACIGEPYEECFKIALQQVQREELHRRLPKIIASRALARIRYAVDIWATRAGEWRGDALRALDVARLDIEVGEKKIGCTPIELEHLRGVCMQLTTLIAANPNGSIFAASEKN